MAVQFAVLASGSRGNAAYVGGGGAGLLIDLGLSGRGMSERLELVGSSWSRVGAVLLTHTHADHVDPGALAEAARRGIALYCHARHTPALEEHAGFQELSRLALVRHYDDDPFLTTTGAHVEPIVLSHDGGATYGFRIEIDAAPRKGRVAIGYIADTGTWTEAMVERLRDVDVLAVEFNHDVHLQRTAVRPLSLIQRNLGDQGHLSNLQGAALVCAVRARSKNGGPRELVLLHLSDQCNTPALALQAATTAVPGLSLHAARQHEPYPILQITPRTSRSRYREPMDAFRRPARKARPKEQSEPLFDLIPPGVESP